MSLIKKIGKTNYQSPEIGAKKKIFDAKSNDIWCVGVCLFKMVLGCEPWISARKGDKYFDLIMDGKLRKLLRVWNKDSIVDNDLLKLLNGFFRYEYDRITIEEIKKYPWFKKDVKQK